MELSRRNFLETGAALAAAGRTSAAPGDRITVGIIGCGARAHELMEAIKKHPQAEIVAVADAYRGRVERAVERTGGRAKVYPTHREVLADKSIDAVVVATPDHWHAPIVLDAFRAGKDVYCEKPLTWRSSEGVEIAAAARQRQRILQVGSQGMSLPSSAEARRWIQTGRLGKVTMLRASFNRNTASGAWIYPIPPDASPETVNWDLFLGSAPRRPFSLERFFRWRCYEDYSGGIATDLFVHLCTSIHYLTGAVMPSRVMAMGEIYRWTSSRDVPDTLNAILEYPEGFVVTLGSTFNNEMNAEAGLHVFGTEGSLSITGAGLTFYPENPVEDNRWIVDSWPSKMEEEYFKDPRVIATETEPGKRPRKQPEKFRADAVDATVEHFRHWFESIRSRQPYWEDAVAGHHAAACAHLVNRSAKERRQVEWDFARDDIRA